ncbi:replication-relaxation family protein [Fictibacillus aquaticus]|uniref:replication-relaxation family protein n=1 Tax=Fictibacillus aquaticus TaxID=2021314 RepID=UPI001F0A93AD|nr:replication-relaxation family protein [Fictibacillus aquaticus]
MKKLDFLTIDQIQRIHGIASERHARGVLKKMEHYLASFREGKKYYYLNKEGRERIGCEKVRKKTLQAKHFIIRNEIYIAFGQPDTWKNEIKLGTKNTGHFICDAWFKVENQHYCVEADYTQKMSENRKKIDRYKKFRETGVFQKNYGHFPELIWITTTEYRRQQLKKMCDGLTCEVFTIADFK